jgi:Holliday junction DNA helicase RuvB
MSEVKWDWLYDAELREIVRKALSHVKRLIAEGKSWRDFELVEIGVEFHKFRPLAYKYNLFRCTYHSSNHTFWAFAVPIEEVERRLGEFEELASRASVSEEEKVEDIPEDFWATVEGYDDLRDLIVKSIRANNPVHILLVGPPSTGKTVMLMEVERLKGSIYITGEKITKAGLTELLLNRKPRYLIVDEVDKVDDVETLSILNTLMESQRLVIVQHNKAVDIPMKVWVFAAANDVRKFKADFLDRFAVIHLKPYDRDTMRRVVVKVLVLRERVDKRLAEYIADKVVSAPFATVRDAVRLARLAGTREEVDKYWGILAKYRLAI